MPALAELNEERLVGELTALGADRSRATVVVQDMRGQLVAARILGTQAGISIDPDLDEDWQIRTRV